MGWVGGTWVGVEGRGRGEGAREPGEVTYCLSSSDLQSIIVQLWCPSDDDSEHCR